MIISCLWTVYSSAQLNITLPQANISSRSNYTVTLPSGTYNSVIGLLPSFTVRSNTANFASTVGGTTNVALSTTRLTLRSIGSLSLLGLSRQVTLSTADATMYTSLATVSSGAVSIDYNLITANQSWVAGTYQAQLEFHTGGLSPNQISPVNQSLSITVPAFITTDAALGTVSLAVNNLAFFRSAAGISVNKTMNVSTTVPFIVALQSGNATFAFSTGSPYTQLPATATSLTSVRLTSITDGNTINPGTTAQTLSSNAGIPVPATNNELLTAAFSISGENLKQGFVQAGTYSVPITFTHTKPASVYPTNQPLQATSTGDLQVVVSELSEIVASQTNVGISFASAAAYQQGVTVQMPAHIRLSRTTPYSVYVRASAAQFSSGANTFPVSVLRIGPGTGQTGVNSVTLSTTPQLLINNAGPVIDRELSLAYSIPASSTPQLLGKPAGAYTTSVIYSFTAL